MGLAGVAEDETLAARRFAKVLEVPMILLAFWIVIEWYLGLKGQIEPTVQHFSNWIIWLFFVVEMSVLTSLVRDKMRFLMGNWLNLVIIICGVPVLWEIFNYAPGLRAIRLFLIVSLVVPLLGSMREVLSRNSLGTTLMVAMIVMLMAGVLIAGIDPGIETVFDGLWWAWVTVTTVGYGDVVPVSSQGKMFGALLIFMGVGLFSLITANISAFFISREDEPDHSHIVETRERIERMEKSIANIEEKLEQLTRSNK